MNEDDTKVNSNLNKDWFIINKAAVTERVSRKVVKHGNKTSFI